MVNLKQFYLFILLCSLFYNELSAQVSVISNSISAASAGYDQLADISILCNDPDRNIMLTGELLTSDRKSLLYFSASGFHLVQGLNTISISDLNLIDKKSGNDQISRFILTNGYLPFGEFIVCYRIQSMEENNILYDDCFEISSSINLLLTLIFPLNDAIIEDTRPILNWYHNEPFELASSSDYYRIKVVELKEGQSNFQALSENVPVLLLNNLVEHQVTFPIDAPDLKKGTTYVWQVYKINDDRIQKQTEDWRFTISDILPIKDKKYYLLGGDEVLPCQVINNKLYFTYDGKYLSDTIKCDLNLHSGDVIRVDVKSDTEEGNASLSIGHQNYFVDFSKLKLEQGFYTLIIKTNKKEKYNLKFVIE